MNPPTGLFPGELDKNRLQKIKLNWRKLGLIFGAAFLVLVTAAICFALNYGLPIPVFPNNLKAKILNQGPWDIRVSLACDSGTSGDYGAFMGGPLQNCYPKYKNLEQVIPPGHSEKILVRSWCDYQERANCYGKLTFQSPPAHWTEIQEFRFDWRQNYSLHMVPPVGTKILAIVDGKKQWLTVRSPDRPVPKYPLINIKAPSRPFAFQIPKTPNDQWDDGVNEIIFRDGDAFTRMKAKTATLIFSKKQMGCRPDITYCPTLPSSRPDGIAISGEAHYESGLTREQKELGKVAAVVEFSQSIAIECSAEKCSVIPR